MSGYANPDILVSTQWVQDHLNDPSIRLVEVDVDTNAYDEGHAPGAISWNWTSQLQNQVRRDILTRTEFEDLMASSGIGNDTTVVLYGDNNNWFAAYALWQMQMYGHERVKLMNGGRKKWLQENRPLTKDVPTYPRAQYAVKGLNGDLRARRDEVLTALGKAALVDVRSPAEFTGEVLAPPGLSETAQRGGHIPGATNVPWSQAVNEDGTFKSPEELRSLYEPKGVTPDKPVIAYCRIGERSSHTWFVLKHLLGYPSVKNYDGSWTEWGSMIDVPIER